MKRDALKAAIGCCFAAGLLLAAAPVRSQDIKERSLRFGFQNTADHPVGVGLQRFAEIVNKKSGGKISVRLFPGGTLGGRRSRPCKAAL
jgi:TRAP-type C4-dicarboxylate transport system substrate-binding protein